MGKILLAGASGALGIEILKLLRAQNLDVRCLVRSAESAAKISNLTSDIVVANAVQPADIKGVADGVDIVISAVGKSVSLFTDRPHRFEEVDYKANRNILQECIRSGVRRFIYISIYGAEKVPHLKVASAHLNVEKLLMSSRINYTIFRPVGFYSGYQDLVIIGKRKYIPVPGNGESKTNSIDQRDLAAAVVEHLYEGPEILEIGGPEIHTRYEMAKMVAEKTGGVILHVSERMMKLGLLLPRFFKRNFHDKLTYFRYVTTNNMIGQPYGNITFREYLKNLDLKKLP